MGVFLTIAAPLAALFGWAVVSDLRKRRRRRAGDVGEALRVQRDLEAKRYRQGDPGGGGL